MHHVPQISGTTRVVALLGDPVVHTLSPALHNAAFAAAGLDFVYVALRVAPRDLEAALGGLQALGLAGANVTIPHKEAAAALMDELRGDAAITGAVNTVVLEGGSLVGHNTDSQGFLASLRELVPEGVRGQPALLLGAGGAGRAVALALAHEQVDRLTIVDLVAEKAEQVKDLVGRVAPAIKCHLLKPGELSPEDVRSATLLVNASPLGMREEASRESLAGRDEAPDAAAAGGERFGKVPSVLVDNVRVGQVVYDVVYGSRTTELVEAALAAGARAADGRGMLTWQAALAFQLWTGQPAPVDEMKKIAGR
jgi:shikimate dehydrogenase